MFIRKAYAQMNETAPDAANMAMNAPSPADAFIWNMGMVLVLVALFYVLLIRPQQKRFKAHAEMLTSLKKGDIVVTGGGLVGTIEKIREDSTDVVVDLGNGLKVTVVKSMLEVRAPLLKGAANNSGAAVSKKEKSKK